MFQRLIEKKGLRRSNRIYALGSFFKFSVFWRLSHKLDKTPFSLTQANSIKDFLQRNLRDCQTKPKVAYYEYLIETTAWKMPAQLEIHLQKGTETIQNQHNDDQHDLYYCRCNIYCWLSKTVHSWLGNFKWKTVSATSQQCQCIFMRSEISGSSQIRANCYDNNRQQKTTALIQVYHY